MGIVVLRGFFLEINKKRLSIKPGIGILMIGIILLAANLRVPITSVGPLIALIRDDLLISNTIAGALTTLPLLAFAFISPFAPKIAKRLGIELTLLISLIILSLGIFLRSLGSVEILFIGTLLIGVGIAIGNVLLPGLVKQNFAHRIGLMTGIYAVSMNLSAAIASGISVPIASIKDFGWRGSLAVWGLLGIIAIIFWLPQLRNRHKSVKSMNQQESTKKSRLWRSSLAWKITIFMGFQSLIYYSVVAWIPDIIQEKGLSSSAAGWMSSLMLFAALPFTFIVPVLAGKLKNQRILVVITFLLFSIGLGGMLLGPTALIALWTILIGAGCGFAFSLSMMFFSLRTTSAQQASEISGMAQSVGYLLAAIGPLFFGFIRDLTSSWTLPLIMLIVASVIIFIVGMGAGKNEEIKEVN